MQNIRIAYRSIKTKIKSVLEISWIQTLYINFKLLPIHQAKKLPFIVFRGYKVKINGGNVKFNVPIKFGMIGFGQDYEIFSTKTHAGEAVILGTIIFNGNVQLGIDTKLYVGKNASITFGHLNSFARNTQIICDKKITFGDYVQSGGECIFVDTNFHPLINTNTHEEIPMKASIEIQNYTYIGIRTTIRMGTKLPNNCMIASNSLCNKDYTHYGENIILAGTPICKCKKNIARDWQKEKVELEKYLKIQIL